MTSRTLQRASALAALVWILAVPVLAQSGTSTISGVVRDSTDAPLPGATVKVVNEDTGVAIETVSNAEGLYRVPALVPGHYRVEIHLEGFDLAIRRPITLEVSQTLAVDAVLSVGKQSETVNVSSETPLVIESQSSNITQTVTRQMLEALPLPNRAASSLAALAPGVVMVDTGSGTAENYPVFSVAGGRTRNQNFILDGGNASNAVGLTRPQQLTSLPVDAMQEFKVITNNYSAEFGHSTGGVVVMSTRSGTSDFHGTRVRIAAERRARCAQLLCRDEAADPAEPVRRHARRTGENRADVFLRLLGTDAATDERHGRQHGARRCRIARATFPTCATAPAGR